jgi:hypothetical protein
MAEFIDIGMPEDYRRFGRAFGISKAVKGEKPLQG